MAGKKKQEVEKKVEAVAACGLQWAATPERGNDHMTHACGVPVDDHERPHKCGGCGLQIEQGTLEPVEAGQDD